MLVEKRNEVTIFTPGQRVDANNSADIEKTIFENVGNGGGKVIIDLSQVDYMSSAGLRVLLVTAKHMTQGGGRLGLCHLNAHVKEIIEVTGFVGIIQCYDSVDQCLASFQ
ncbi:MAG: anti-sigma factor antagonist [Desulfuromonas sp.]|nr:MAG: anti-sigma factor antagonist [Desulfuromonas sp.]